MTRPWEYTDDPADPCGYCCGWACPAGCASDDESCNDYEPGHEHVPMGVRKRPDGGWDHYPLTRIYRGQHRRCAEMVAAYEADCAGDLS